MTVEMIVAAAVVDAAAVADDAGGAIVTTEGSSGKALTASEKKRDRSKWLVTVAESIFLIDFLLDSVCNDLDWSPGRTDRWCSAQ